MGPRLHRVHPGLIYQWQSGALNEAYSDICGETLDLINGRQDEGEGDITAPRPDGLCSKFTRGAIGATINAPAEIAGPCAGAAAASFGPVFDKAGVTTDVVVGHGPGRRRQARATTDGCSPLDQRRRHRRQVRLRRPRHLHVHRQDRATPRTPARPASSSATTSPTGDPISIAGVSDIYGLMVTQADGTKIKSVPGPVNMTIKDIEVDGEGRLLPLADG